MKRFFTIFYYYRRNLVHNNIPETKELSKQWTAKDEPAPEKAKVISSTSKVMATVFWDSYGVIFVDYLEKGKTINGELWAITTFGPENQEQSSTFSQKEYLLPCQCIGP